MEISSSIMHQFFQLTRIIALSLNRRFGEYNLHFSEWGIILVLMGKEPMTQREMAGYLHIEPSAVSRSLARLEQKGYIVRKEGSDRREKKVYLTELAQKQYLLWDDIAGKHRRELLAGLSPEKQNELYLTLTTIFEAAQHSKDVPSK